MFITSVYLCTLCAIHPLHELRDENESDTESTSDERDIGGDGKYSHGDMCLTHQHWVDAIISTGAFAVQTVYESGFYTSQTSRCCHH